MLLSARDRGNAEIAGELYLSAHTVKTHLNCVFSRTGSGDRVATTHCAPPPGMPHRPQPASRHDHRTASPRSRPTWEAVLSMPRRAARIAADTHAREGRAGVEALSPIHSAEKNWRTCERVPQRA
ncbi:LuxR C-terminal-related transcriptional regulator [Streptomyces sp. NPDC093097]|uniref:LuxR C-terminal-related transcriptional regulator n=1 Tax=Streptomyces sp. NPDC093097 TaxID=3366027 RepID=UPI0037F9F7EE